MNDDRTIIDGLNRNQMLARAHAAMDQVEAMEKETETTIKWWNEHVAPKIGAKPMPLPKRSRA